MKYLWSFVIAFTLSLHISAQQNHFIYFQTEGKQPFYIKLDSKTFNSNSSGYLIVPRLKDGSYKITLGFPNSEWPEQLITYKMEKDAGYLLKNFSEKGWGFFDLQSLNVTMADKQSAGINEKQGEIKSDNFSEMLATVVNDSSILQTDVPAKKDPERPREKSSIIDSVIVKKDALVQKETFGILPEKPVADVSIKGENNEVVKQSGAAPLVLYSVITKKLQLKSKGGLEMIYLDESGIYKDTIRIFIPAESAKVKNQNKQPEAPITHFNSDTNSVQPSIDKSKLSDGQDSSNLQLALQFDKPVNKIDSLSNNQSQFKAGKIDNVDTAKFEPPVVKLENNVEANGIQSVLKDAIKTQDTIQAIVTQQSESNVTVQPMNDTTIIVKENKTYKEDKLEFLPAKAGMTSSNCKQQATEEDFLKLRKKMAAENNDDDMISVAKKTFRAKCFTTKDIKNLGALFLNDHGRYNFFDAAYFYVSDPDMFSSLQNQLSDDYYVKRFKAMIEK